jgi:hypothetical protein
MITYPVDKNARFTFVLGADTRRRQKWPRSNGEALVGADQALVIMRETMAPDPAFDPTTHRLGEIVWADNPRAKSTVGRREVVPLTEQEIAEAAEWVAKEEELAIVKGFYQDLIKGVGDETNRLVRLEMAVARLLRDSYSDIK